MNKARKRQRDLEYAKAVARRNHHYSVHVAEYRARKARDKQSALDFVYGGTQDDVTLRALQAMLGVR